MFNGQGGWQNGKARQIQNHSLEEDIGRTTVMVRLLKPGPGKQNIIECIHINYVYIYFKKIIFIMSELRS